MAAITNSMIARCYELGRDVHDGKTTQGNAIDLIARELGMNRNSAQDYISNFGHLLNGRRFTRAISVAGAEYYLGKFLTDYGPHALRQGLSALAQHIEYYKEIAGVRLRSQEALLERMMPQAGVEPVSSYPDEVAPGRDKLWEGAVKTVRVNVYERNPVARQQCIDHYGHACSVCGLEFGSAYGDLGAGFIHVHHLRELASVGVEYVVDPIEDLRPVCPNCHAMLHRRTPALSIDELRRRLQGKTTVRTA